jgi:hypothetical protein
MNHQDTRAPEERNRYSAVLKICIYLRTAIVPLRGYLLVSWWVLLFSGCGPRSAPPISPPPVPPAPEVTFTDVTAKAGIRFKHVNGAIGNKWLPETMGSGCAFLDYDHDGWLDILLINSGPWPDNQFPTPDTRHPTPHAPIDHPHMALYRNNHDGTFTDVTRQAGLDLPLYGMGVAVGDYDNDGYQDLFITVVSPTQSSAGTPSGGSRLLHNEPDGKRGRRFRDVTDSCGIHDTGWATSAAWVDFDRDGRLDLFVCHYVKWSPQADIYYSVDNTHKSYARPQSYQGESCRLYRNLPNGKFEDVTKRAHIENIRSKALGVTVCDYDGDGWPDLFVANDTEANFLYHNQGDGTFKEIGDMSGIALSEQGTSRAGMGIDSADVLHNGTFDILITNFAGEQLTLYRQDSTGLFLDVAARSGVGVATQNYLGFGAFFFDYDLDGWTDLFINNGHINDDIERRATGVTYKEPTLLFRNLGQGRFVDVTASTGADLTTRRVGRGAAWGDYDNDGSPDILVMTNGGSPALLHNSNRTGNGWIRLQLEGTVSNRDAIGARVRVTVGSETQTQEVRSGSSYLSSSDRRLLFGLGKAAQADSVKITWPSGKVQSLGPIARMHSGETLSITEEK